MICVTVKRAENVDLCRSSVTRPLSSPSGGNDKAKEGNQILFVYTPIRDKQFFFSSKKVLIKA
ncbi:hypothetical protein FHS60_001542 [Alloprevotella rava]|uniref:Uncharacterized protein n=1 Tax=Alloprevotella rava TaxID=671218 RepID=A0A7W5UWZ9_9BACT|nr:hypothetical protein [Alloprevotella rava]